MTAKRKSKQNHWEFSLNRLLRHPAALLLGITLGIVIVGSRLWESQRSELIDEGRFVISPACLEVTESPDWVPDNWLDAAFRDSRLDEVSLLEYDAAETVANALAVQPWVRQVTRVRKRPQGMAVDLEFRQPIAVVEIGNRQLIPVDKDGVVLDGKYFAGSQTEQFWRISVRLPVGRPALNGQIWPDSRVVGAAAIARAWESQQQPRLGLRWIVNDSLPDSAGRDASELNDFQLWTANQLGILWGSAPGLEKPGEAQANKKIAALIQFAEETGGLLTVPKGTSLDVRSGQVQVITRKLVWNFQQSYR